ncbi:diguanylate cyclase [Aquabacterium sp. A08]|uniref:diguanylate cyclase n=1 Tax=Aquabacterium sp. A08 TaxID=2718532 RepID=UPI00141FCF3A|nr:diguanylate cyclase [Aquabacterium sp. A08]NIC40730.1 diguanylate cyclase [Aquabacterium sp. A08]
MAAPTPQDIAREAVKLLTTRKLPPTPDNFQSAYHEVAGTRPLRPFPLDQLRQIGNALPDRTPAQQRFRAQFSKAVTMHSWEDLEKALVLTVRNGSDLPNPTARVEVVEATAFPPELLEQTARIIHHALPAVGNDDTKVVAQAEELVTYLRLDSQHPPTLRKMMADFAFRLSFVAEEQEQIRRQLLALLQTVFEQIGAISPDTPWLQQQMAALAQATQPPLSARRLEDVQRRLRDVILQQTEASEQTHRAQQAMKETLGVFLERLAQTAASSDQYQAQFEDCADRLERAQSLTDMAPVLQEAIQSARAMALDTRRTGEELHRLRERASQAEAEVERLRQELDRMSEVASHDLLTGVLNRKGLLEVVNREISRADRMGIDVCLAVLDIDDFKKINDEHGHLTGDAALKHLADVALKSLRPHDSVARYGGEEFVVVLPDTTPEEAVSAITRLQRELTTHLFMQGEQHLLITFSAGVTRMHGDETSAAALHRADQAMYAAKRAGKNRVVLA